MQERAIFSESRAVRTGIGDGKGYALGSTASFPDSEVGFSFDEKAETHDLVAVACKTEGPEGAGDAESGRMVL